MNAFLNDIVQGLQGVPRESAVAIIGALPGTEVRGGVIAGINFFHLPPLEALALAAAGNLLAITPALIFLERFERMLRRNRVTERCLHWAFAHVERNAARVQRWGPLGLLILTSLPLPGAGAWTGVLIALLLGLRRGPVFASLYGGVIIGGAVMMAISTGWEAVRRLFGL